MRYKFRFILLCLAYQALPLCAQNFSGGFNFYLPPHDTSGSNFLPRFHIKAIGSQDFVGVDPAGEFSVNGARLRFFGVNLVDDGAFPTKAEAPFVAGRLRNFGFNLVRLHHLDNPWTAGSIFEQGQDTRHLNPTTLDRLEYLIAQLKANGVYLNMNLHVSRTFRSQDGVAAADSIWNYAKGVSIFDPQLIALQKEYARQLLTHVNPYTGLRLADDPVMAMMEITNENLLYGMWQYGALKSYAQGGLLMARHHILLNTLWHEYLQEKYSDDAALAQSWNQNLAAANDQIANGNFESNPANSPWAIERFGTANGVFLYETANPFSGQRSSRVIVSGVDGTDWHVQFRQLGMSMKKDSVYTVSFAARSDENRTIAISIQQSAAPFTYYAGTSFQLGTTWQKYSYSFIAPATSNSGTRLAFIVGASTGSYWFDEVTFGRGAVQGLDAQESLTAGTVRRIDFSEAVSYSDNRVRDMTAFYIKLQNDFFAEMKDFLKDSLGVRVPITSTNLYAGLADLAVQSNMDYLDNHSYWDHPSFPADDQWSPTNWLIANSPMVRTENGGTLPYLLGGVRYAGKPFTISEYNHPFPNRYQSEGVLFLTTYSAFQNVNGLMFFDYNSDPDWQADKINNYFSIHRNSAMMALMPSCALAYRDRLITSAQQTLAARFNADDVLLWPKRFGLQNAAWPFPQMLALQHAVVSETFENPTPGDFSSFPTAPANPYVTDTGEINWNTNGLLKVVTPKFVAATGFFNDFPNEQLGAMTLLQGSDFGAFTWISLDGAPLETSRRSLLTIVSKAQNSGMVWDGINTIHNNWGTAPTTVFPLRLEFALRVQADSLRAYPLDANGNANAFFKTVHPTGRNSFSVVFDQQENKTLWFGIERFGSGTTAITNSPSQIFNYSLEQNYPNPFNPTTRIQFSLAKKSHVTLRVYDLLGREVVALVDEVRAVGHHTVDWNGVDQAGQRVGNGVCFYQIKAGEFISTRRMLLLK